MVQQKFFMRIKIISAIIILTALAACQKSDPIIPVQEIKLDPNSTLVFGPGSVEELEFTVIPADADFNPDASSQDCQIRLGLKGSPATVVPQNYSIESITLISEKEGRYKARIRDKGISSSYDENAFLRLTATNDKGDIYTVTSGYFRAYIQKAPLFRTIRFLQENNKTALDSDHIVDISTGSAVLSSPKITNPNLTATFESSGAKVYVDGVEQISGVTVNDFSKPVTYTVKDKIEYTFTISLEYSGLPLVFVETAGGKTIPSKWEDWLEGSHVTIYNTDWTVDYDGPTSIRGRGNSTWGYPKKPYALKLDSKAEILGMPKHKRWVLLANWMDRTLLRNRVSFNLAERTDLAYTPRGEFVELFVNGKHMGNYLLCEQIKVDKNRVNIDELDGGEVDGGYLLELDAYFDEAFKFRSEVRGLPYMFKDPDEVSTEQFDFLQGYINNLESALYDDARFAAGEYEEYIDVTSFVDWWLVMELSGIWEPNHPKSCYMHKDKGGRLTAGPVWDFDWETYMPMNWFRIKDALYYGRLFQDPKFRSVVKERWAKFSDDFRTLPDFIRSEAEYIRGSEKMNHQMWPITQVVNQDEKLSFDDAVERMISAYESKLNWMDREISKL